MAIITISRGCFSHGKEIAEKLAGNLGYKAVSREILLEASRFFNVPEKDLLKSLHDAPTVLERITHGKDKYLAYIQAALLEYAKEDNIVYHGHAGHLLLPEVPHILKVRIIADLEERISFVRKEKNLSRQEAMVFIENEDRHRMRWTHFLYKKDLNDPKLYDLVVCIGHLTVQDACQVIAALVRSQTFATTSASRRAIQDMAITSHIKAALQDVCEAEVDTRDGVVHIKTLPPRIKRAGFASTASQDHLRSKIEVDLAKEIAGIVQAVPGVKQVTYDIQPPKFH